MNDTAFEHGSSADRASIEAQRMRLHVVQIALLETVDRDMLKLAIS